MLTTAPEHGLTLFARLAPPLPLPVVLPHMKVHAPAMALTYLETELTSRGAAASPEFHNELVWMHLEAVRVDDPNPSPSPNPNPNPSPNPNPNPNPLVQGDYRALWLALELARAPLPAHWVEDEVAPSPQPQP